MQESNVLLANFLEWKESNWNAPSEHYFQTGRKYDFDLPSNFVLYKEEEIQVEGSWTYADVQQENCFAEDLKFHSDWNWLMQVVKKINVIDDYRFTVKILSMDVEIYDNVNNKNVIDYFSPYSCDELERAVYEACVQFVKWYNQQK